MSNFPDNKRVREEFSDSDEDSTQKVYLRSALRERVKKNVIKMQPELAEEAQAEEKQAEEEPPQKATVELCIECASFSATDNRNKHFCRLLNEELKYIQPCMRSRCYVKIFVMFFSFSLIIRRSSH
uniref:Uncharacterized protein n=1 Tax=Pectinophora gossypiella TaxID=13191 RepID=A0A1E1WQA1_PECGO